MTTPTNAADPTAQGVAREKKAWLQKEHPDWSIVHSSADRWWAFLDTSKRGKNAVPVRTTDAEADTPEGLHELLVKAES